jgi:hypothetical protein
MNKIKMLAKIIMIPMIMLHFISINIGRIDDNVLGNLLQEKIWLAFSLQYPQYTPATSKKTVWQCIEGDPYRDSIHQCRVVPTTFFKPFPIIYCLLSFLMTVIPFHIGCKVIFLYLKS